MKKDAYVAGETCRGNIRNVRARLRLYISYYTKWIFFCSSLFFSLAMYHHSLCKDTVYYISVAITKNGLFGVFIALSLLLRLSLFHGCLIPSFFFCSTDLRLYIEGNKIFYIYLFIIRTENPLQNKSKTVIIKIVIVKRRLQNNSRKTNSTDKTLRLH